MKWQPYDGLEQDKATVAIALDELREIRQAEQEYNNSTDLSELYGNETLEIWKRVTESEEEASQRLERTVSIYSNLLEIVERLRDNYSPKRGKFMEIDGPQTGDQQEDAIRRIMYEEQLSRIRAIEDAPVNLYKTDCQFLYDHYGKPPLADELHKSEELIETINNNQVERAQKLYCGFLGSCSIKNRNYENADSLTQKNMLTQQQLMANTLRLKTKLLS